MIGELFRLREFLRMDRSCLDRHGRFFIIHIITLLMRTTSANFKLLVVSAKAEGTTRLIDRPILVHERKGTVRCRVLVN